MTDLMTKRRRIEAKIEELIGLLDFLDGDCDLEDCGDDEPSFSTHGRIIGGRLEYDLEEDPAEMGLADLGALDLAMQDEDYSGTLKFNGDGADLARQMLRQVVKDHRQLARALHRTRARA